MRLDEIKSPDYMAGHCHVMAIALKQLHPDWAIRARIGWDEDGGDEDFRVDHVFITAPDGTAYDCRGRHDSEDTLLGPDETGGEDVQVIDFDQELIKDTVSRGELRAFTKRDIEQALALAKKLPFLKI